MKWSVVVVILALSGCAQPPDASPVQTDATVPEPVIRTYPFEHLVTVDTTANSVLIGYGVGSYPFFVAGRNESVIGLDLHVPETEFVEGDVAWSVSCVLRDGCEQSTLASGSEPLPFDVSLEGLELPRRAELVLHLSDDTPTELAIPQSVAGRAPRVAGTVRVMEVPLPPVVAVKVTEKVDGHSGPCNVVTWEPTCTGWPGGTSHLVAHQGIVVSGNVTMTWDSTSPLDAELGFVVQCGDYLSPCHGRGAGSFETYGPSPLRLDLHDLEWDGPVMVAVFQNLGPAPVDYAGTRTPVHIEATFIDERPVTQEDEGTGRTSRSGRA